MWRVGGFRSDAYAGIALLASECTTRPSVLLRTGGRDELLREAVTSNEMVVGQTGEGQLIIGRQRERASNFQ